MTKSFGRGAERIVALDRLTLDVAPGEFLCLVGASGCGKSTLLNLIAGLDGATAGTVDTRAPSTLMFQEAALFPWLTVAGQHRPRPQAAGRARRRSGPSGSRRCCGRCSSSGFGDKRPHELSGGMRQRVAIARAFAQDVDILLMDEPFGALDAMTRDMLHDELERLWADRNLTVVFVTHNVREAVRLGDRVVLLSSRPGRVIETFDVDTPRPRRIDTPEVSALARDITVPTPRGGAPPCRRSPLTHLPEPAGPTLTEEEIAAQRNANVAQNLAGLDALELADRATRGEWLQRVWSADVAQGRRRRHRACSIWQMRRVVRMEAGVRPAGPATVFEALWDGISDGTLL